MLNQPILSLILLAAAVSLSGCGADSVAFTYRGDESAWQKARLEAKTALAQKDYASATAKYTLAAAHARHLQSTNPHHYVETLGDLANAQEIAGDSAKAKQTFQDMLTACDALDKQANANTSEVYRRLARFSRADALLGLGNIATKEKDYANAEQFYKRGLEISEHRNGPYPTIGKLKRAYADLLEKQGKEPETAKRLREEARLSGEGIFEGL